MRQRRVERLALTCAPACTGAHRTCIAGRVENYAFGGGLSGGRDRLEYKRVGSAGRDDASSGRPRAMREPAKLSDAHPTIATHDSWQSCWCCVRTGVVSMPSHPAWSAADGAVCGAVTAATSSCDRSQAANAGAAIAWISAKAARTDERRRMKGLTRKIRSVQSRHRWCTCHKQRSGPGDCRRQNSANRVRQNPTGAGSPWNGSESPSA